MGLDHHSLESVAVFDGLPSRSVNLHPVPGGWDLSGTPPPSEGVYLVCNYRGTSAVKEIRLPDGVRGCWFGNNWPHVTCR